MTAFDLFYTHLILILLAEKAECRKVTFGLRLNELGAIHPHSKSTSLFMKISSDFICILLILSCGDDVSAFQRHISVTDSGSLIQKKIKEEFREVKRKKVQQIKRIVTRDSTIIYGADKNRTQMVHVHSVNKQNKRYVQFTYNEKGVIWIVVLRRPKKLNVKEKRQRKSAYYFDRGNLIYSKERNDDDDIAFLLSEADRYLRQGRRFLNADD